MDVKNAFLNAKLPYKIYQPQPPPLERPDYTLVLHKVLYGLKESPLLWQQEVNTALSAFSLKRVTDAECLLNDDKVTVLYSVDNVLFIYHKKHKAHADSISAQLKRKYDLGTADYFLGIKISRDRTQNLPEFYGPSDASHAHAADTRRSSEGDTVVLLDSTVDWNAVEQSTVTTSSTEAELLSLSHASSEMMWWQRTINALHVGLDQAVRTCARSGQRRDDGALWRLAPEQSCGQRASGLANPSSTRELYNGQTLLPKLYIWASCPQKCSS
nr:putative transposon ty5-1 protein [Quercus suber]